MSETYTDAPESWVEVETHYKFQVAAWRNVEEDNVLVVEEKKEPWHSDDEATDVKVALLGSDPMEDPEPIRTILEQTKDIEQAVDRAHEYMGSHPSE